MTDMHTVRASGPDDLLALVPSLLGFHPESSVVLLTVGDARHRFHARVDLPDDPPGVEELTGYLAEVASRHGLTRAAAVVYTQDAVLADAVAGELDRRLDLAGVDLVCVIRADGERWWPFHGGDDGPGTPYDVGAHPLMAQAVLDGTLVRRNRQELADSLVGDDPGAVERVARLAEEVTGRLVHALSASPGAGERRAHLAVEGRWVRSRVCRHLEDGVRLDDHDLARMLTLLAVSLEVRDVAWAEMSHANAEQHVALWLDAVRRSPVDLRAAPASLLGFAAWLSGEGALAWCAVDCAQEAEPDYGLAALLTQALAGAVPPSAWQPIPREVLTLFAD